MVASDESASKSVGPTEPVPEPRGRIVVAVVAVAIALFALGCTALPFVPPRLCGQVAMTVSVVGALFAITGIIRHHFRWSNLPCIIGLVCNLVVVLIAWQVWGSKTHVIDKLERGAGWILGFICFAPLIALFLVLGVLVWAGLRRG